MADDVHGVSPPREYPRRTGRVTETPRRPSSDGSLLRIGVRTPVRAGGSDDREARAPRVVPRPPVPRRALPPPPRSGGAPGTIHDVERSRDAELAWPVRTRAPVTDRRRRPTRADRRGLAALARCESRRPDRRGDFPPARLLRHLLDHIRATPGSEVLCMSSLPTSPATSEAWFDHNRCEPGCLSRVYLIRLSEAVRRSASDSATWRATALKDGTRDVLARALRAGPLADEDPHVRLTAPLPALQALVHRVRSQEMPRRTPGVLGEPSLRSPPREGTDFDLLCVRKGLPAERLAGLTSRAPGSKPGLP
jgi:hypothetical protein